MRSTAATPEEMRVWPWAPGRVPSSANEMRVWEKRAKGVLLDWFGMHCELVKWDVRSCE
jgi:hypothetical protein